MLGVVIILEILHGILSIAKEMNVMTNDEKLIKFLNNKFKSTNSNPVRINRYELPIIELTEEETVRAIHSLAANNTIIIERISNDNDLSITCEVKLLQGCLRYFEAKRRAEITDRREWIRTYIPITLSVIAIIISIIAIIVSVYSVNQVV